MLQKQKSTRPANPGDSRKWYLVDAKDQVLGRLAVVIANKLRAKDTPSFDPSVDAGAFVIVFFGSMPHTASLMMRSGCEARICAAVKRLRPSR